MAMLLEMGFTQEEIDLNLDSAVADKGLAEVHSSASPYEGVGTY